jgi:hypothetical protein
MRQGRLLINWATRCRDIIDAVADGSPFAATENGDAVGIVEVDRSELTTNGPTSTIR